ncbi:MAG: 30S ribosomal protein S12 methylthiotransferase RimO [Firmicutes bacterium]|nr:30S ribosomal protein S12 methylthiotransferase RimO [Bacillota bacterium]
MEHTVYLLTLGCAKNLVDAEVMSGALRRDRFVLVDDPAEAETIIINTCGFIESAKVESIRAILELAEYKENGRCRALLAVGCMPEKYADEMLESMPELDGVCGSHDYQHIGRLAARTLGLELRDAPYDGDPYLLRELPPGSVSAYLKIGEGCDNRCAYCLIPQLRGPYQSRPLADILTEARSLLEQGVREVVIIAQDITRYGSDLPGDVDLAELVDQVAGLPFDMVRLLYLYPDSISDRLLQVMAAHANVCRYLDIPIQHGSDRVLQAMHRHSTRQGILDAVARVRRFLPDAVLRTTVMVGFPGEDEEDFRQLLELLDIARFDWLGAFPYFREDDTPAAELPDQVPEEVKQQRLERVMDQAAEITAASLRRFVGRTLYVLAEAPAFDFGEDYWQGRSQYQAPEVDGTVYFRSDEPIEYGAVYPVLIEDCQVYDLAGRVTGPAAVRRKEG